MLLFYLNVGHWATTFPQDELVEEDVLGDGEPGALREELVPEEAPEPALQLSQEYKDLFLASFLLYSL